MHKLAYENPLLKHVACFNIRDTEKEENTEFVRLDCQRYVKRATHSVE